MALGKNPRIYRIDAGVGYVVRLDARWWFLTDSDDDGFAFARFYPTKSELAREAKKIATDSILRAAAKGKIPGMTVTTKVAGETPMATRMEKMRERRPDLFDVDGKLVVAGVEDIRHLAGWGE